jgi:hypothetical protein
MGSTASTLGGDSRSFEIDAFDKALGLGGSRPLLASADTGFIPDAGTTGNAGVKPNYWTGQNQPRTVRIGKTGGILFNFDFHPTGQGKSGKIDGPNIPFDGNHDGAYKIVKNDPGNLEMDVNIGTNDTQTNDMDVELLIRNGKATLTGKLAGQTKAKVLTENVKGMGTKANPFKIEFPDYTLQWF